MNERSELRGGLGARADRSWVLPRSEKGLGDLQPDCGLHLTQSVSAYGDGGSTTKYPAGPFRSEQHRERPVGEFRFGRGSICRSPEQQNHRYELRRAGPVYYFARTRRRRPTDAHGQPVSRARETLPCLRV